MVLDLQLRAIEQPISRSRRALKVPGIGDDSGAHFSREYMTQLVIEVQQALATAGMDGAARQAEGLLLSNPALAQQAVPKGSSAGTSYSVDILASELHTASCLKHMCVSAGGLDIVNPAHYVYLNSQSVNQSYISQPVISQSVNQRVNSQLCAVRDAEPVVPRQTTSICLRFSDKHLRQVTQSAQPA